MLDELLKAASKRALAKNLATHDGTHTYFKFVQKPPKANSGTPKAVKSGSINSYFSPKTPSGRNAAASPLMDDKYEESVSEFYS